MIHYRNNGVGVKLVRKKTSKTDNAKRRIYWQVTYKRKSVLFFTGNSFDEGEWYDFNNKKLGKHKQLKTGYQNYFDNTLRPIIDNLAENNNFSFEKLEEKILSNESNISVNNAFRNFIDMLDQENKIGNASIYSTTLNALMRYKYYKHIRGITEKNKFIKLCIEKKHITRGKNVLTVEEKISFNELTPKFLNDCEKFWLDSEVSYATIGMYMRTLRAIINNKQGKEAYLKDEKYPFGINGGKYEIPEGGRKKIAMPIEDIWRIENFETDIEALAIARDIFVFMFYCNSLNFGDLCRLTYQDIDAPRNEIVFLRKKTLKKGEKPYFIYAPILSPITEIINRQGNKKHDGYIFPFLNGIEPVDSNEKIIKSEIRLKLEPINSSLKYIANKLELDPNLTTSYTRNSYITHLTSTMFINPIVVKMMVGHSTKKDVTAGYVELTPKNRREINMKLINPNKTYNTINAVGITG